LYLQAPFVQEVERLGLVWAFTLKENQPELLREAERLTQESPAGVHVEPEPGDSLLALAGRRLAGRRIARCGSSKTVRNRTPAPRHGQRSRRSSNERQDGDVATEHQLLRHQFRTSARSPRCSFISSVAAVGESIRKSFQTITTDCHLKTPPRSTKTTAPGSADHDSVFWPIPCHWSSTTAKSRSHARRKCDTFHEFAKSLAYWFVLFPEYQLISAAPSLRRV